MIESIFQKALEGQRIDGAEALQLFGCTDMNLLGNVATRLVRKRLETDSNVVTYIVDRNINYTNVCVTDCSFCAFYRHEGHDEAYVLPFETIAKKIEEMIAIGGRQILMQGGHHKDLRIDYFEDLFKRIKERFDVHLHALSPPEIVHTSKISKIPLKETTDRRRAGFHSRRGRGNPGRPRAQNRQSQKMLRGSMAGGDGSGPPSRTAHHRHHDVRPCGNAGGAR
jgi:cyclic dehypoxanthinyl futalosine synthase